MKNYTITVNGNVYDVVVEEGASAGASADGFVVRSIRRAGRGRRA